MTYVPHGWGKPWGEKGPHPVYDAPSDPIFERTLDEAMEDFSRPDPYPNVVTDYANPLVRCSYCGVSDTALMTCPHCGGPRHWH